MAEEESHFATLIDNGKDAALSIRRSLPAILTLRQAISLGFVVMGAIEKPTADADEWNTVIHRLVTAALPATLPSIDPDPDHEDLSLTTAERNNFNDANDVDRIMEIAQANDNPRELIHLVQDNADAIFTWNYDKGERQARQALREIQDQPVERHHRSRLVDRG